jgi:hypothetical protein
VGGAELAGEGTLVPGLAKIDDEINVCTWNGAALSAMTCRTSPRRVR